MEPLQNKEEEYAGEQPPILKSWKQIYSVVFLNLVALVILFYMFTRYFS